ncbi:carbonic anhydrase [Nitratifractor sp.]
MKRIVQTLTGSALLCGALMAGGHGATWGYSGKTGPKYWGDLDPKFAMCKLGKNQSPVDITGTVKAELKPLNIDYRSEASEVLNNGHTVKVNFKPGGTLEVDGKRFALLQYHFHTPSETAIDGKLYPMEAHLVHADKDGNLAVVSVMFKVGATNADLDKILKKMPKKKGEKYSLASGLGAETLLPKIRSYYRFSGSLTTPPCSEDVRWFVMSEPVELSKEQLRDFEAVMGKNNRPVQPINARLIIR